MVYEVIKIYMHVPVSRVSISLRIAVPYPGSTSSSASSAKRLTHHRVLTKGHKLTESSNRNTLTMTM